MFLVINISIRVILVSLDCQAISGIFVQVSKRGISEMKFDRTLLNINQ
jgi:hypothetical protein